MTLFDIILAMIEKSGLMKKIKYLLVVILLMILSMSKVNARTITIEEVAKAFNESEKLSDKLYDNQTAKVNTDNKTLEIYNSQNELEFYLNYTDDSIEMDNRSFIADKNNYKQAKSREAAIKLLTAIIPDLVNKEGIINPNLEWQNTYDTYGLQIESEYFETAIAEPNGPVREIRLYVYKYFKMSLDSDKLTKLVNKYLLNESTGISGTIILETREIGSNYIKMYLYVKNAQENDNECIVYRSLKKDSDYKEISENAYNCKDGIEIIDNNLTPNTTYYYKAMLKNQSYDNSVYEITTKDIEKQEVDENDNKVENTEEKKETVENPDTGLNVPFIGLILFLSVSIIIFVYTKKYKKFNKI